MGTAQRPSLAAELRQSLAADFAVNPYRSDRLVLAVWRLGQHAHGRPGAAAFALRRVHTVLDSLYVRAVMGAELPRSAVVGPGIRLPHSARGVILHPAVRLGAGVTLYHRVTMGVRGAVGPPTAGDGVYIGPGAVIAGAVHLGDGSSVGANAVVLEDVPARATAVGARGRVIERSASQAAVTASSGLSDVHDGVGEGPEPVLPPRAVG